IAVISPGDFSRGTGRAHPIFGERERSAGLAACGQIEVWLGRRFTEPGRNCRALVADLPALEMIAERHRDVEGGVSRWHWQVGLVDCEDFAPLAPVVAALRHGVREATKVVMTLWHPTTSNPVLHPSLPINPG